MEARSRTLLPPAVVDLRNRLNRWRSSQTKRRPIPEDLWKEAADLARKHGVSQIATSLGLGYYGLKERAEGRGSPPAVLKPTTFLEVESTPSFFPPGFMLEVGRKDGTKMTMRLSGPAPIDLAALVRSFLGMGR